MSQKIVSRIFIKTQKPSQLIGAIIGCFLGFFLIFIAAQLFADFKTMVNSQEQSIGSQFLVVNKQVSVLNSLKLGKSTFSKNEVDQLKSLPSIKRISEFTANQFEAVASMSIPNGESSYAFRTELFMESVGDDFLDVKPDDWNWELGNEMIPMILPTDFINLYNFNFAPGRGLPQLSKSTIQLAVFDIDIHGAKGRAHFTGKIVGFSNRISSVLVPKSFMNYANSHYGNNQVAPESYRIIVEAKQQELPKIQQYFKNEGYETNEELLKNGKFGSLLQAILGILAALGIVVMFVSVSSFILYVQLAISRSKYEIETLLQQGYPHKKIVQWYSKQLALIFSIIAIVNLTLVCGVKSITNSYLENFGFEAPEQLNVLVIVGGFLLIALLWIIQTLNVRSQIYSLALPNKK
jgi:cell division protein FtsX